MKSQQRGIILAPLLIIIGAVVVAGFATYFLIQNNKVSESENANVAAINKSVNNINSAANTNQVANNNASTNTNTAANTNAVSNTNTVTTLNTNSDAEKTIQVKGWLLIYNPDDPALTLEGQVFDPNVWYVSPRELKFPGTKETDYKLDLTSATCAYPDNDKSDTCNGSQVRWGYGDRVVVDGKLKNDRVIKVTKMTAVSSQPVEQW